MPLNSGVGDLFKEIQPVHPKGNQSWVFLGRTDVEAETPILWPLDVKSWLIGKDPDAGERSRTGGEGDDRGWDGWMASPTQWKWVWVDSGNWWWTGRPRVLQFMGSQKSRTRLSDWNELNWSPFMLLQMTLFHSFLWLSNTLLHKCVGVAHLINPFIYWWAFGLLPHIEYCR